MLQLHIHSESSGKLPYFVHVPANYQIGKPVPLIVMLHGCTQTAAEFAASTRMNELAEQYHFIVAYPQQTVANNRTFCWNWLLRRQGWVVPCDRSCARWLNRRH